MPDPIVVVPEVKSGWKTTELYVVMLLLGGLGFLIEQLLPLIGTIAANPAMPPWAAAVVPLAIGLLGWAGKAVAAEYIKSRAALKLGAPVTVDVTAAVAAGASAAVAGQAATLAAANR